MNFGFSLELSNVNLLNIDLLDTHLDLLDADIPSKYFACLHNVFKTSSRHVFKTSSRRLQRNNFTPSKTSSRPTNVCWVANYVFSIFFQQTQKSGVTLHCFYRESLTLKGQKPLTVVAKKLITYVRERLIPLAVPLDEIHLIAVRGLIHQEVSTKVRQRGELN